MKWNRYWLMTAFFLGILTANLIGRELFVTYGLWNTYYIEQYSYAAIDFERLLLYVSAIRMKEALFVVFLYYFFQAEKVLLFLEGLLAYGFGILQVAAILGLGVRGLAVVLLGMLPQWFCYPAVLVFLYIWKREQGKRTENNKKSRFCRILFAGAALFFLGLGIWTETYVNPVMLQKILQKF